MVRHFSTILCGLPLLQLQDIVLKSIAPISIAAGERDKDGFAQALGNDFTRYGFAVISEHGIAPGVI